MMKRVTHSACAKWLALGLLVVVNSTYAASRVKTAAQAVQCQPDTQENGYNGTCPYPADLYRADPVWKKDMESALQQAGIRDALGPDGSLNGPEDTLEPVTVGGKQWLQGSLCEQGNCGDHYLRFLYSPGTHQVLGFYVDGQARWVGKPSAEEAKRLRGDADAIAEKTPLPSAPPAVPAAPADGAPANTIWTFKGDGGKSLWQVCGGQNSSCTIIANTKYYVAILNRKSAHSCAFGDFYVVARESSSWQRYDTGTCSSDAWIRKGTISNGQYLSVDIGVNNQIVQQYPIGYWSMKKEFSGNRRPSWSKVKEKNQQH
ncbi:MULTISPECIES: inhibitor of vertebrate lysozyme family protein [Serratia]|nr:inhibitor of vertebrate lysozyme family protein [Serratia ureilytica]